MSTPADPFAVEIVGREHPHRGRRGTLHPSKLIPSGGEYLAEVEFDRPDEAGVRGCFVGLEEFRRLAPPQQKRGEGE